MTEIIPIESARNGRAGGETRPAPAAPSSQRVYVVFTDIEGTLNAVRVARRLVLASGGRVIVVHFRPLDFGAPLDAPAGISPVQTEEFRERLEQGGGEVDVSVCLCRDARQALPTVLGAHSLVVVGGRRHWWRTAAERWRRTLEQAGYAVVVVTGTNDRGLCDA